MISDILPASRHTLSAAILLIFKRLLLPAPFLFLSLFAQNAPLRDLIGLFPLRAVSSWGNAIHLFKSVLEIIGIGKTAVDRDFRNGMVG